MGFLRDFYARTGEHELKDTQNTLYPHCTLRQSHTTCAHHTGVRWPRSAARVHCTLDRDERGRNLSKLREHLLGALELPQRVEEAAAR